MTKIGDRLAVQIEGIDVAEAVIENIEDGLATIVIPATRLVVQTRQSLDLNATKAPEVDRVFAGVQTDTYNSSDASESLPEPPAAPSAQYNEPGSLVGDGIHGRDLDSSAID